MDRRALIAIVLCGLIWAGWAAVYYPKQTPPETPTPTDVAGVDGATPTGVDGTVPTGVDATGTAVAVTPTAGGTPLAETTPTPTATPEAPPEVTTFEDDHIVVRLTNDGARILDVTFPDYKTSLSDDAEQVVLFGGDMKPELEPLAPRFDQEGKNLVPSSARFEVVEQTDSKVVYRYANDRLALTRTYAFDPEHYRLLYEEKVENTGTDDLAGHPVLSMFATLKPDVKQKGFLSRRGRLPDQFSPTALVTGRVKRRSPIPRKKKGETDETPFQPVTKSVTQNEPITWFGVDDRYFLAVAIPTEPAIEVNPDGEGAALTYYAPTRHIAGGWISRKPVALEPGASSTYQYDLFLGPKDYDILKAHGYDLPKSLNIGRFLTPIATVLLVALRWFHSWLGNWGLSIILLTLIMKGLLLPLTHKSMKMMRENSTKMAKLNPEISRLKEKYSDPADKDKLNQETMALFQKHGVNPLSTFGGCVPMVLQMPIWFALYRVLYSAIDLRQAPLAGWIHDLAAPDPFYVLPLLLGVVFFAQQLVQPQAATPGNETQMKMMKYIFPVMFTFIMLNLPAGLVLYILINSLLSIGQSLYINKTMPAPAAAAPAKT